MAMNHSWRRGSPDRIRSTRDWHQSTCECHRDGDPHRSGGDGRAPSAEKGPPRNETTFALTHGNASSSMPMILMPLALEQAMALLPLGRDIGDQIQDLVAR